MLNPAFALLDQAHRQTGGMLAALGLGAVETPFRIAGAWPGARLRAYQPPDAEGPVLLIMPAPIKPAYIWDLLPPVSVVRHGRRRGLRIYMLEWRSAGPAEDALGLADYADRIPLEAIRTIEAETGARAVALTGHSLGGTLAATFAALHPERIARLALIDAPLAFGPGIGGPLPAAVARAPDPHLLCELLGSPVPGCAIGLLASLAAPQIFLAEPCADLGASLLDPWALALRARVTRWILDELAMPSRLFEEVVEEFYRHDRLAAGTLTIGGRRAGLAGLRCPLLAVTNPTSQAIPPDSVLAGLAAAQRNHARRVLEYPGGDRGVMLGHLGPLIGPTAHAKLWPEILDWVAACARPEAAAPATAACASSAGP